MHAVSAVIMKNSFGNGQDRSRTCDLASCAASLGSVVRECCSFHDFPGLRPGYVVIWEE